MFASRRTRFRRRGKLIRHELGLHVDQVRQPLRPIDGALAELPGLRELANRGVEAAERIDAEQVEQSGRRAGLARTRVADRFCEVAEMHIGDGGDVRVFRSPFVDDLLQLSELIRRDGILAQFSRLSFQAAIRLSQRRRALAEALGDPVIVDHHAA